MNILLVSPYYSPGVGGSSRLLQDVIDHLHGQGHRVEVLTYGLDPSRNFLEFDKKQPYSIHRVFPQRLPGGSSLAMLSRLLLLAHARRYDVILSGVAFPSAILVSIIHRLTRIAYAVYAMSEDVTCVEGSKTKRFLLTAALRKSRRNMVISRFTQSKVEELGVKPERVSLIPPGIDAEPYLHISPEEVKTLQRRYGLEGKRVILTVGRLAARKGHDMIVRALPQLMGEVPNLCYLVVGKGDPSELKELAASNGVADRLTIVDYVADADLPALYHLCDIYAMVSRWDPVTKEVEGFGIVYLEAAACGKPCVAGSAGGSGDAVQDGVTGFVVEPTDVGEITEALRSLLVSPRKAVAMGKAGRARVLKDFDRSRLLAAVETCLMAGCTQ